jgi:peptidoglycan/LPS O-acetylase OafA/YrhL
MSKRTEMVSTSHVPIEPSGEIGGLWRNPKLAARIPELDGLRGLAILLVLICHLLYFSIQRVGLRPWQELSFDWASLGLSGVDLFFVLSGFLIGGILYDAKRSKNYFRTFYARRLCRIFPIYFLWLALFVIGLFITDHAGQGNFRSIFNHNLPVWPYPLFLQNFALAKYGNLNTGWMGVTWSLAVEEQFYLLLPLLIRTLSYRGIWWFAAGAVVLAPIIRLFLLFSTNYDPYYLFLGRMDSLGLGVLSALACRDKRCWAWLSSHRLLLWGLLFLFGSGFHEFVRYPGLITAVGLTWFAGFYTVLLLLTIIHQGELTSICFRSPALVKLGAVSYAVYLIHVGLKELFHCVVFGARQVANGPSMSLTALSLVVTMLLAAVSWRFIERPIIRFSHAAFRYD